MFNAKQATDIMKKNLPDRTVKKRVIYNGLYLFQAFSNDPDEGDYDPFFSVDMTTGKFSDFSILTDGDITEINRLFSP